MTITRAGVVAPTDPCGPPGDPLAEVPDGLFRVEVLDGGTEATARFAWSFEDGGTAIAIAAIAGDTVTLAPSTVRWTSATSSRCHGLRGALTAPPRRAVRDHGGGQRARRRRAHARPAP